jgi:hypothetical protein
VLRLSCNCIRAEGALSVILDTLPRSHGYSFGRLGANCEAPEGGSQTKLLGPLRGGRLGNSVLKSLLFLIPCFLQFWVDLGYQNGSKIVQARKKMPSEVHFDFEPFSICLLNVSSDFQPLGTNNLAKTIKACSFFHTFAKFFLELSSGINFVPSWLHFGMLLGSNFYVFCIKRSIGK